MLSRIISRVFPTVLNLNHKGTKPKVKRDFDFAMGKCYAMLSVRPNECVWDSLRDKNEIIECKKKWGILRDVTKLLIIPYTECNWYSAISSLKWQCTKFTRLLQDNCRGKKRNPRVRGQLFGPSHGNGQGGVCRVELHRTLQGAKRGAAKNTGHLQQVPQQCRWSKWRSPLAHNIRCEFLSKILAINSLVLVKAPNKVSIIHTKNRWIEQTHTRESPILIFNFAESRLGGWISNSHWQKV